MLPTDRERKRPLGCAGHRGIILGISPNLVRWADCACIAGDPATYAYVREEVLITAPQSLTSKRLTCSKSAVHYLPGQEYPP